MRQITSAEWKSLSADYKIARPNGERLVLSYDPQYGTVLEPVEIIGPSSEADQVALERLAANTLPHRAEITRRYRSDV